MHNFIGLVYFYLFICLIYQFLSIIYLFCVTATKIAKATCFTKKRGCVSLQFWRLSIQGWLALSLVSLEEPMVADATTQECT